VTSLSHSQPVRHTGILSIAYLGPVRYFSKFLLHNSIIIEKHENYSRQTYRNRCEIYGANGRISLSIPVKKGDEHKTLIKDVRIEYDKRWQHLHWKSIESAYRSSPFYEFFCDDLAPFFSKKEKFLFDFNFGLMTTMLNLIEMPVEFNFSDEYISEPDQSTDYRDTIHPKNNDGSDPLFDPENYNQVFGEKHGFQANLSILDLVFNEGPNTVEILTKCIKK